MTVKNTDKRVAQIQARIEQYLGFHLCIIPVERGGKKPLIPWKPYQKRLPTSREIEKWTKLYWSNGANIGVVCGKVSGNLVVLDFDTDVAWNDFRDKWKQHMSGSISATTLVVKTGRGHQVYVRVGEMVKKQKLTDGFDLQGEGSYVVAPPSIHQSGAIYTSLSKSPLTILEIQSLDKLGIEIGLPPKDQEHRSNTIEFLNGVPEGERNEACFRYACRCVTKGLKREETLSLCKRGADNCTPPFPHGQVKKCVRSAYGYQEREMVSQEQALTRAKTTTLKWLRLKDPNVIDLALAVIVANKAAGDPVWVLFVGAPGTGKSEILRGLFSCKQDVHPLGGFTANTFSSGYERQKAGLLETLPAVITLVVKDFGTLLTMRHDDKAMILQQLREIYDGMYRKEYGNGKVVMWEGRMGLLGAVTTAIEAHHGVIGELGNRYLLYRFQSDNKARHEVATRALNDEGSELTMRKEISSAFKAVLENKLKPELVEIPLEIGDKLASLADLVSRLRSPVSRSAYDKTVNYQPDIEGPARLVKSLAKLGKGLSALRGEKQMTEREYEIVRTVGRDTIPQRRITLIQYLMDEKWHGTKNISLGLNVPQSTINLTLEDLLQIRVLKRKADIAEDKPVTKTTPYKWKLRKGITELIRNTQLLE